MKLKTRKSCLRFQFNFVVVLFLTTLFSACKSTEPAFTQTPSSTFSREANVGPESPGAVSGTTKPAKTLPESAQKLQPDTTKPQKPVDRSETYTPFSDEDEDAEPQKKLSPEEIKTEKIRRREKEKGKWLSGSFVGSGMALLIAALVMVIIGSGPAGLLAIIGGVLFLVGFILSMLALLGR